MFLTTVLAVLLSNNAFAAVISVTAEPVDTMNKEDANCVVPSADQLVRILSGSDEFLAYIPSDIDETSQKLQTKEKAANESTSSEWKPDLHCPVGESFTESSPIRLRSVCPWELLDDFDSNRYPKTIQKAVCRCNHCLNPQTNQPDDRLSCGPVLYPMPVLRRTGCKDGVATFKPSHEQIAVACDCKAQGKVQGKKNEVPVMTM